MNGVIAVVSLDKISPQIFRIWTTIHDLHWNHFLFCPDIIHKKIFRFCFQDGSIHRAISLSLVKKPLVQLCFQLLVLWFVLRFFFVTWKEFDTAAIICFFRFFICDRRSRNTEIKCYRFPLTPLSKRSKTLTFSPRESRFCFAEDIAIKCWIYSNRNDFMYTE